MSVQQELKAMGKIVQILEKLDSVTQQSVMKYLHGKYCFQAYSLVGDIAAVSDPMPRESVL